MTDQNPYNEQIPMMYQSVDDGYQADAQGWTTYPSNSYPPPAPVIYDSGSYGWAVLGFLFPLVGFILFLSWQWRKPNCAQMAGLGALISAIAGLVFAVVSIFLAMGSLSAFYNLYG